MVHEMTAADGTLRVVSFPWCIKFRSVCKNLLKRMKLIGRRSSTRGVLVKRSSNKHRISWTASFAYRQQQKQKLKKSGSSLWSFSGYSKLKNSDSCTEALDGQEVIHRNLEDSQASSSSFSFKNDAEDLGHGKGKKILSPHPGVQRSEAMKLKSRWDEVVEMVVADSFDDLVDLEEFLGYYMLRKKYQSLKVSPQESTSFGLSLISPQPACSCCSAQHEFVLARTTKTK